MLTSPGPHVTHAWQGVVHLTVHTVLQQHQPPVPRSVARTAAAPRKAELARSTPADMSSLRGVLGVSTLARSETAADKVRKRLEERRRAEAAP